MISHHIKFAFRDLVKNKLFALVSISGLAISILCCLFIAQYSLLEFSYDQFHDKGKNIYRVNYSRYIDGEFQYKKAQVFPAVGEALLNEVPQVINFTRIFPINTHIETVFSIEDGDKSKTFQESSLYAVDSSFLSIFSFPLIKGDSSTALSGANRIVLSESAAKKYFGESDPVNRIIHFKGMGDWTVTGVFKNPPANSHMKFEFLVSWLNVYGERSMWNWDGFFTYVLLEEGSDLSSTQGTVQQVLSSKINEANPSEQVRSEFELQPLSGIHLESNLLGEMYVNGSKQMVMTLIAIGIIILIVSLVNFINLSLARMFKRVKEFGVRKVIGSRKIQIVQQFFLEAFIINGFAVLFAIILAIIFKDIFNALVGIENVSLMERKPVQWIGILTISVFILSLAAAIIPSRFLINQNPINSLKGIYMNVSTGALLKRGLLTFQFMATAISITGTIIIHQQSRFMRTNDLGFDINQKLVIKTLAGPGSEMDSLFVNQIKLFRTQSKALANIGGATVTSNIPGRENEWQGRVQSTVNQELIQMLRARIDEDFFKTFKIDFLAGKEASSFENVVIINESAAMLLGYTNPAEAIGNKLFGENEIIGVVKDYNERSLHSRVEPSMYTYGQGYMKFITVDIQSNVPQTVDALEKKWSAIFPDKPFEYFFLDDYFNQQYATELRLERIFTVFSGLSIFIACLGIFGYSYFVVYQKTKEIGIRKVLGASSLGLIKLLTSEFILLILISGTLSIPIAYYLANFWLSEFAYKIDLRAFYFIIPTIVVAIVAFITIQVHIIKAIRTNPVDSLKYE